MVTSTRDNCLGQDCPNHKECFVLAARREALVDKLHGAEVPDPYRWLEDIDSKETTAFVADQAKFAEGYLEKIPQRAKFLAEAVYG